MKKQLLLAFILLSLSVGTFVLASFSYQNPKHPFFKPTDISFEEFIGQFPKKDLPFEISHSYAAALLDSMKNQEYIALGLPDSSDQKPLNISYLAKQHSGYLNLMMARNPIVTFPVAQFTVGEKIAVLYSKNNLQSAYQHNLGYCRYILSVFDAEGHLLTETECGHIFPNSVATFLIKSDLNIAVKYYSIADKTQQTNGFIFERDTVIDTKNDLAGINFYQPYTPQGTVIRVISSN